MADKLTTDILNRVADMPEKVAKKILAEIFLEIRKVGVSGYTEKDAYKAIENIYRSEVVMFIMGD